jgi:hypothetical protein
MKIENVVLGSSIKALLFAYKKGYVFIPSKNNIQPLFNEYLGYEYTYMQFGLSDKTPTSFRTNVGYKLYGPHKRELYDRIVNEMSLAGLIYFLDQDKILRIKDKVIDISTANQSMFIEYKNLFVFEVDEAVTDFSSESRKRYYVHDWFTSDNKKFESHLDMIFLKSSYIKRIIFSKSPITNKTDCLVISRVEVKDLDLKSPASVMFDVYDKLQEFGIDFDFTVMERETYSKSLFSFHNKISKGIIVPDIPLYKLLKMKADRKSNLWTIKKAHMKIQIPRDDEKAYMKRKGSNLGYDPIH